MRIPLTLLVAIVLLASCEKLPPAHYQLAAGSDGRMFRVNTQTGDVFGVNQGELYRVPEPSPIKLAVGQVYKFEDDREMEYLGNGAFKKTKPKVIRFEDLPNK